jgi:Fe-S-cluster containining protein
MEESLYLEKQQRQFEQHEAVCKRCGACCGAFDVDPCAQLRREAKGTYVCADYENRLGQQRTTMGKRFTCVGIRDLKKFEIPYLQCAYNKKEGWNGDF